MNFLSFLNSPASKISVSFSILSCSTTQALSSALVGNSGLMTSDAERRVSNPTKTSIGGICSSSWKYIFSPAGEQISENRDRIHPSLFLNPHFPVTKSL